MRGKSEPDKAPETHIKQLQEKIDQLTIEVDFFN